MIDYVLVVINRKDQWKDDLFFQKRKPHIHFFFQLLRPFYQN